MTHAIKEEEFRDDEGLHEHGEACADASEESDDIHGANGVEDDEAWAGQGLLSIPERHLDGGTWSLSVWTEVLMTR